MIEKRYCEIKDIVLKLSDIRNLAKTINSIREELQNKYDSDVSKGIISKDNSPPEMNFEITTEDRIQYSTSDINFFSEDSIITSRVISKVYLQCIYFNEMAFATIELADSSIQEYSTSVLIVQGRDTFWVHATFQQLQDYIANLQKQNTKIRKLRWPLSFIISAIISWTTISIIVSILGNNVPSNTESLSRVLTVIFILSTGVLIPFIADKIDKLWPKVELIPGVEYKQRTQRYKANIRWFIAIIFIPFILSLVIKFFL